MFDCLSAERSSRTAAVSVGGAVDVDVRLHVVAGRLLVAVDGEEI
ncbi:hypothetical protein [Haloarcula sp. JP-Z28]|nr:hypothetical protein [Haloarcula sp. JP-Z28]